jgi:hypothetical protein
MPICRKFERHLREIARLRALFRAGNRIATSAEYDPDDDEQLDEREARRSATRRLTQGQSHFSSFLPQRGDSTVTPQAVARFGATATNEGSAANEA